MPKQEKNCVYLSLQRISRRSQTRLQLLGSAVLTLLVSAGGPGCWRQLNLHFRILAYDA